MPKAISVLAVGAVLVTLFGGYGISGRWGPHWHEDHLICYDDFDIRIANPPNKTGNLLPADHLIRIMGP